MEAVGIVRKKKYGAPTAARLKRMSSIRGTLNKGTVRLHDMQDVAGCRIILANMKEVNELVDFYLKGGSKHPLVDQSDDILKPKKDGYRCQHLIFRPWSDPNKLGFKGQKVEMQIRSQLQHSWATSVEAVGLYLGQDLKGGNGDKNWLRFFELMSSELAAEEGLPLVPTTSDCWKQRHAELLTVGKSLDAIATLDAINKAISYTEDPEYIDAQYFLIVYTPKTKDVKIERYSEYAKVSDDYIKAEQAQSGKKTVLVEADAIEELKLAYPNYFLDVNSFLERATTILT